MRLSAHTWFKNVDDPISIAIGVNVTYEGTNSIGSIANDKANGTAACFSMDGKRVDAGHRGIQIIRNADGTVTKRIER